MSTRGPSSSQSPYLVPLVGRVQFTSLLSAGETADTKAGPAALVGDPWRLVGKTDGLGYFDNDDGSFTLLANHELGAAQGVEREHGETGAFVSKLTIDKTTLEVVAAEDLVKSAWFYDRDADTYTTTPYLGVSQFERFCSADLAPVSAFFNAESGLGTQERIFLTGEESSPEGRAFAHVVTGAEAGQSFELPWLGRARFENLVTNPATGDKTVVIGTDDATPGEVYVYVGDKQAVGSTIERAGLTGGSLFGIAASFGDTTKATPGAGSFQLIAQGAAGDASHSTGTELQAGSGALTQFVRPEDGAWDPSDPNRFYFATTGGDLGTEAVPTRLWALTFTDITRPDLGGTVKVVVEGHVAGSLNTNAPVMLDNLTVTESGLVVVQEDPGGSSRTAKIWLYDPSADHDPVGGVSGLKLIAQHDPNLFDNPGALVPGTGVAFGTAEESSGIVDATALFGANHLTFLLDSMASYADPDGEIVGGGQLMALTVGLCRPADNRFRGDDGKDVYDGGFGNDRLKGASGNDKLMGNYGDDTLIGGRGNDKLYGGPGEDQLAGSKGRDKLYGGNGDDTLAGGGARDKLCGDVGDDTLSGGGGPDALMGGFGNDVLMGGSGRDTLYGGRHNDVLVGGGGADTVYGEDGADSFVFTDIRDAGDTLPDFTPGVDHIELAFGVAADDVIHMGFAGGDDPVGPAPTLTYTAAGGALHFDPTGGDPSDQVLVATLTMNFTIDRDDIAFV